MTGEQHYPRVHYVFSDDDPGITTDVALRALNRDTARYGEGGEPVDIAQSTASVETSIIVDLADDGETVQEVRSLSPEWQVFEHSLTPAPSCSEPNAASEESLMLRIVGRGIPLPHPEQNEASQAASNDQRSDQSLLDRIETLSRQFNQGLEEIRKLAQRPQQEGQQRSPNRS